MADLRADDTAQHGDGPNRICLACGRELEEPLARLGSLRCHTCRDNAAALDALLVDDWQRAGAGL